MFSTIDECANRIKANKILNKGASKILSDYLWTPIFANLMKSHERPTVFSSVTTNNVMYQNFT